VMSSRTCWSRTSTTSPRKNSRRSRSAEGRSSGAGSGGFFRPAPVLWTGPVLSNRRVLANRMCRADRYVPAADTMRCRFNRCATLGRQRQSRGFTSFVRMKTKQPLRTGAQRLLSVFRRYLVAGASRRRRSRRPGWHACGSAGSRRPEPPVSTVRRCRAPEFPADIRRIAALQWHRSRGGYEVSCAPC
jgi:hypothetical protein